MNTIRKTRKVPLLALFIQDIAYPHDNNEKVLAAFRTHLLLDHTELPRYCPTRGCLLNENARVKIRLVVFGGAVWIAAHPDGLAFRTPARRSVSSRPLPPSGHGCTLVQWAKPSERVIWNRRQAPEQKRALGYFAKLRAQRTKGRKRFKQAERRRGGEMPSRTSVPSVFICTNDKPYRRTFD